MRCLKGLPLLDIWTPTFLLNTKKEDQIMELDISPNFTLEDIDKVRKYYYEITKNMSYEEQIKYYEKISKPIIKELGLKYAN